MDRKLAKICRAVLSGGCYKFYEDGEEYTIEISAMEELLDDILEHRLNGDTKVKVFKSDGISIKRYLADIT